MAKWFCNACGIVSDTEYCGKCGKDCDSYSVRKAAEKFYRKMDAQVSRSNPSEAKHG